MKTKFCTLATLMLSAPALATVSNMTDVSTCRSLLPIIDPDTSAETVNHSYDFYTDHRGWRADEPSYSLAPKALKTYTVSVKVSGPGSDAVHAKPPVVCEMPIEWQAQQKAGIDLVTPTSLYDFPGLNKAAGVAPAWSAFGGLLTMNVAPNYQFDIGWFLSFFGGSEGDIGQAARTKYPTLGTIDVSAPLSGVPKDGVIAFQILAPGDSAASVWAARTSEVLGGLTFPVWKPSFEEDASTMMANPVTPLNVYAPQTFVSNSGGINVNAFDLLDVDGSAYGYSATYCAGNQCSLSGISAMNSYIDDRIKTAQRADRTFTATLIYRVAAGSYARGVYEFSASNGFTTKSFDVFNTLASESLDWLQQYRTNQGFSL